LLFGIGAFDIGAFSLGVGVLCAAAMAACYVPLRRAVSVDPMITLRSE
jgi:ABC-type antimicrobial peptide transport system permease subunit